MESFGFSEDADNLQFWLCVIGHTSAADHRGGHATELTLCNRFPWGTLTSDVHSFVAASIHCVRTNGCTHAPHPLGHAMHGAKPNHLLQFDSGQAQQVKSMSKSFAKTIPGIAGSSSLPVRTPKTPLTPYLTCKNPLAVLPPYSLIAPHLSKLDSASYLQEPVHHRPLYYGVLPLEQREKRRSAYAMKFFRHTSSVLQTPTAVQIIVRPHPSILVFPGPVAVLAERWNCA